ncbi:MAG TPA: hypothetical protein VGI50_12260 [Solirubrobacteraceae bacterium]|jgi:FlaG/FlaF family flagellin (archaellin)
MSIKRLTLTKLATLAAVAAGLLFTSAPALATELYEPDFSFGSGGPGTGTFSNPQGVAVDQSSGAVYVFDNTGGGSIYKFDSSGNPAEFSTLKTDVITGVGNSFTGQSSAELAVDNSTGPAKGDVYLAAEQRLGIYASSGTTLGELTGEVTTEHPGAPWGRPCGVSVDPTGRVYIGLFFSHASMYTPTANPVTDANFTSSMEGKYALCNIAADGLGNVYTASFYGGSTTRYTASQFTGGPAVGTSVDGSGNALTVDPATDELFVDEGSNIAQFDSAGTLIRRFATLGGESLGVATRSSSKEVYVADTNNHQVDAFKLVTVQPPAVNDQPPSASGITRTSALLSGTVNPQSRPTQYTFVYGPTSEYVRSTPLASAGAGSVDQAVGPVGIEGLLPGTTYHYALRATNIAGTTTGPDHTFTAAAPTLPLLATGAPSNVTQTGATLSGTVSTQGLPGTYGFEIGTASGSYGPRIGLGVITAEASEVAASFSLGSLQPGTTYYYRITATNTDGTSYGVERSFTTTVLVSASVSTPVPLPFLSTPAIAFPLETKTTTVKKEAKGKKAKHRKATPKKRAKHKKKK